MYDIKGKKIVSVEGVETGSKEITIGFDDGVFVDITAKADVVLDHKGRLIIYPTIEISTFKVELKEEAEEEKA